MSFLSGILGKGNAADKYVDQAVDTAAKVAKQKVKTMLAGDDSKKKPSSGGTEVKPPATADESKKPSSGGTEVKPPATADESKKASSGGTSVNIGGGAGSINVAMNQKESSTGGDDFDLTDTLGDIAKEMSGEK